MSEPRKRERTRGTGSLFQKVNGKGQKNKYWHIQYFKNDPATGKRIRIREATGLESRPAAEKFLRTRLGQIDRGELFDVKRVEAVRVEDLFKLLVEHTKLNATGRRALAGVEWKLSHLRPVFGPMVAANVTTDHVNSYKLARKKAGAALATINRELAALRRAYNLGKRSTPPKVRSAPYIELFREDNVRQGFVEDADYRKLEALAQEHALKTGEQWLRVFLELAYTYGWRRTALLGLRVKDVNLIAGTIRLDPKLAKNREGLEVRMTAKVRELVTLAVHGKKSEDFLFTRASGKPVCDFRGAWKTLCEGAGLEGLLVHDLRRSAAKAMRRAGVPESVIMATGGWKTPSMLRRYSIVSARDQQEVVEKLEQARQQASVPPQPRQAENEEPETSSERKRAVQ